MDSLHLLVVCVHSRNGSRLRALSRRLCRNRVAFCSVAVGHALRGLKTCLLGGRHVGHEGCLLLLTCGNGGRKLLLLILQFLLCCLDEVHVEAATVAGSLLESAGQ